MKIEVSVPATSANLGPGFDVLGLALGLWDRFHFDTDCPGLRVTGCPPAWAGEDNLAVKAWRRVEAVLGAEPSGLSLQIDADIPPARGLGSSAALLAAGAVAANRFYGDPLSRARLLDLAAALEGHPDNAAPALLGGLRASMASEGGVRSEAFPVHPSLGFCAMIPDFETSTARARAALPEAIPFRDAVANLSALALTLRALEAGDLELLGQALKDRLHQPYRKSLIHGYDQVEAEARAAGAAGFCLSGSGSTLLAILERSRAEAFAREMAARLAYLPHHWRALPLEVDLEGARLA